MSRGAAGEGSLKNEPELYAMEDLNWPEYFPLLNFIIKSFHWLAHHVYRLFWV